MGAVEEMMCVVYVSVTKGGILVMDVILRKFDLREGDLFVLS